MKDLNYTQLSINGEWTMLLSSPHPCHETEDIIKIKIDECQKEMDDPEDVEDLAELLEVKLSELGIERVTADQVEVYV